MKSFRYLVKNDRDPDDIVYHPGICLLRLRKNITSDRTSGVVVYISKISFPNWILDRCLWAVLMNAILLHSNCRVLSDVTIFLYQISWWRYITMRISKTWVWSVVQISKSKKIVW